MLRSILIGLDGSTYSTTAVELAIRWARRHEALLVGLGVVDEPTIRKPEPVPLGASHFKHERDEWLLVAARHRVEELLDQFAQRCADERVRCKVLEAVGSPYEQILEESRHSDLLMLGQQTYFHFETQDHADETVRKAVQHSTRPVVIVPDHLPQAKTILIAYNGSPEADHALQAFQALGLIDSEQVHVVSISSDPETANRWARSAADFLHLHALPATPHPVQSSDSVSATILAVVQELQPALLVMGASSRPSWRQLVFGSVTRRILNEVTVPVLLCH